MNSSDEKINELMSKIGAETGTGDKLKKAAQLNPKVAAALNSLSENDMAKINEILSDKDATKKILATVQAQAILKKLKGQE